MRFAWKSTKGPGLLRAFWGAESGISAVEFALILPVLVFLGIGTADLGMAAYADMQVQLAADAGQQYAALHPFNSASIASAVTQATTQPVSLTSAPSEACGCASSSGVANASCGSNCPAGGTAGTYVRFTVQATYTTLLQYPLLPSRLVLSAAALVRVK